MEKRPHARVIELKEHIKKIKRERQRSVNAKTAGLKAVFSQKIKRKLKEVILK